MSTDTQHDFTACVKALSGAMALSSRALQSELAVSLFVFHTLGGTSLAARRDLRQVYADAGRPCLNHEDSAYQTVMRRIGRSAALFEKIGPKRVAKALNGHPAGAQAIHALVVMLAPLELLTMDDVAAYVRDGQAKPSEPKTPAAPVRRATDGPEVVHVKTTHIDVAVPPGTSARELVSLANKLLALADKM